MTEISTREGAANGAERMRLDKWLWAARFFKTRSLAAEEIARGRVSVNDQVAKASRDLRCGDRVDMKLAPQQGSLVRSVMVVSLSHQRGPAQVAQGMYAETDENIARRVNWQQQRREHVEPAETIEHGRPTKRDRRQISDWNRWSASIDPD